MKVGDLYETTSPIYKRIIVQIYEITPSYVKVEVVESKRNSVVANGMVEWPLGKRTPINIATFSRIWKKCKDK